MASIIVQTISQRVRRISVSVCFADVLDKSFSSFPRFMTVSERIRSLLKTLVINFATQRSVLVILLVLWSVVFSVTARANPAR